MLRGGNLLIERRNEGASTMRGAIEETEWRVMEEREVEGGRRMGVEPFGGCQ